MWTGVARGIEAGRARSALRRCETRDGGTAQRGEVGDRRGASIATSSAEVGPRRAGDGCGETASCGTGGIDQLLAQTDWQKRLLFIHCIPDTVLVGVIGSQSTIPDLVDPPLLSIASKPPSGPVVS